MEAIKAKAAAKAKELAAAGAAKAEKLAAAGAVKAEKLTAAGAVKAEKLAAAGAVKAEELGGRAAEVVDNAALRSRGIDRRSTILDPTAPGFSSQRQRYMCTAKELRSTGFKGRVRMICVALDYEGTASPLGCVLDAERLSTLAKKSGCGDITKLYDDGSTPLFPCREGLVHAIAEVGGRCEPNDYLVFSYSGHGGWQDNPDAPTGVDCTLCLRTIDGEDDDMVDGETQP